MTKLFGALQNVDTDFQELAGRFGVDIVLVCLDGSAYSPVWADPDIAKSLADELERARAGRFDACDVSGTRYFCFYHVHELARGIEVLKQAIASRNLLQHAAILVSEPENKTFRLYWPPTADGV